MRTLYRTHFQLDQDQLNPPSFHLIREEILSWASTRPGLTGLDFPENARLEGSLPLTKLDEHRHLETRHYSGKEGEAWGLRLTLPDEDPDVSWVTETTVFQNPSKQLWFSTSLMAGRIGETLGPVFRPPNAPAIVRRIVGKYPGKGILPLGDKPLGCSNEEAAKIFLKLLTSPSRKHPIVFVASDCDGRTITDTSKLAERLSGLAYVIVSNHPDVSDYLQENLSPRHNCINSGVRLYWPGFTTDCNPLQHPLWTRRKIESLNEKCPAVLGQQVLNRIASAAAFITPPTFVSWTRILDWQRSDAIAKARADRDQDKLITLFEEENQRLQADNTELKALLEEKSKQAEEFKSQADNYRTALTDKNDSDTIKTLEENVSTVSEALDLVEEEAKDRLVFAWNSKSEADTSPYQDAPSVLAALRWLASTYHDSKTGKSPCADLDRSLREAVIGWSFESHQSKNTMKHRKFKNWYHTKYEGKEFALPSHLRCGSTKDARHCIRIGFTWDSDLQKVILGYLGQHQENSSS